MTTTDRPLFIVGCPRSGTGILHQIVRLHPSVAWITPFSNWICGKSWFKHILPSLAHAAESILLRTPNAVLPSLFRGPFDGSLNLQGVFETHEGHSIWNRTLPDNENHRATETDASPDVRSYLHDVVQWHVAYHRRPRFVGKTPRNVLRLRFLHEIFPTSRIVHLVRDGRPVAVSIAKRYRLEHELSNQWWGARPPGWRSRQTAPPLVKAAWTWKQCLHHFESDASVYPKERIMEMHYESFASSPQAELRRLFSFADFSSEDFFQDHRRQLDKIHPPASTWKSQLSTDQKRTLNEMLSSELKRYGYPVHRP